MSISSSSSTFSSPGDSPHGGLGVSLEKGRGRGNGNGVLLHVNSLSSEDSNASVITNPPSSDHTTLLELRVKLAETLAANLFSTIASLKSAYIELQAAHSPYDAYKLQSADRAVIAELRKLSDLKRGYNKQEESTRSKTEPPQKADPHTALVSQLQAEMEKKNAEIQNLKASLTQAAMEKTKLEQQVKHLQTRIRKAPPVPLHHRSEEAAMPLDLEVLESTLKGAYDGVRSFTKVLVSLMKSSNWNLDAAAGSIQPDVQFARRSHKRFAFESYVSHRMMNGFEHDRLSQYLAAQGRDLYSHFQWASEASDPLDLMESDGGLFVSFCERKFLEVVHPRMEESFFGGHLEHRDKLKAGMHPQTAFYQAFLACARAAWLLHVLAFSFEPPASIFQVRKGVEFSPLYMESAGGTQATYGSPTTGTGTATTLPKVAFTVMPGFRASNNAVAKCQVYLLQSDDAS